MLQYSVYSRTVRNRDDADRCMRQMEAKVSSEGAERALIVTEKQYGSMYLLMEERLKEENLLDTKELIEL